MIKREADLEHFCRDKGLVTWSEMKSCGWDSETFEQALTFLIEQIKTRQTSS